MDIDRVIASIAERYLGLVPVVELREQGVDREARARRVRSGQLEIWSARVLRVAGTEPTLEQRIRAGTLDVAGGAVGSVVTASWVWGFPAFAVREVEVTALRTQHRTSSLAIVHRPVTLLPHHVTEWRGIPVTSVARTIWDLAAVIHPLRLERLIDTVCAKSPAVLPQLHRILREVGGRGVPGTVVMRDALSTRPVGIRTAPSGYQARFEEVMANAGITGLRREVDVGGHSWIGRVDYRCDVTGALVEIDSKLHHSSPTDVAADRARDATAIAAGFTEVVRIDADDLYPRPHLVVAQIRDLRSRYRNAADVPRSGPENGQDAQEAG